MRGGECITNHCIRPVCPWCFGYDAQSLSREESAGCECRARTGRTHNAHSPQFVKAANNDRRHAAGQGGGDGGGDCSVPAEQHRHHGGRGQAGEGCGMLPMLPEYEPHGLGWAGPRDPGWVYQPFSRDSSAVLPPALPHGGGAPAAAAAAGPSGPGVGCRAAHALHQRRAGAVHGRQRVQGCGERRALHSQPVPCPEVPSAQGWQRPKGHTLPCCRLGRLGGRHVQ